ncbi:hypothetical protein TTHERM_000548088 (macronuclear) [Tetrahymena thermophila SB210]|uniref:Uncharacterized protein n=1 Tax=Tetrahymena thermophila (strain SB210) TaxID=312017 RepID=W7XBH2_TETTS|nr:hypothetical protein TTHERM_000548088 [Tetrahymena thermophila SB210]EWS76735.1 hypothetical protein TTHERM_000548088 [Tetrahymena thermophila SB210]|eukprot:XP_012650728.1 hypothetical protein TTHERM_000548088 [Tetrahymena thermophila SB210]
MSSLVSSQTQSNQEYVKIEQGHDMGSLSEVNKNYINTNFFNNIPRTRDIVKNGTISHDDQTFGILNQKIQDTFQVNIKYVSLQEFFKLPQNGISQDNVKKILDQIQGNNISNLIKNYVEKYINKRKEKLFDVSDMFKIESEEKQYKIWNLEQNQLIVPKLDNLFQKSDKYNFTKIRKRNQKIIRFRMF